MTKPSFFVPLLFAELLFRLLVEILIGIWAIFCQRLKQIGKFGIAYISGDLDGCAIGVKWTVEVLSFLHEVSYHVEPSICHSSK